MQRTHTRRAITATAQAKSTQDTSFAGLSTIILAIALAAILAGCAPGKHIYDVNTNGEVQYFHIDAYQATSTTTSTRKKAHGHAHAQRHRTIVNYDAAPLPPTHQPDDFIPREYAKFVSSRGPMSWRARSRMCREARAGYCNYPNIPHCHGAYCHAHPGGNVKHTH